MDTPESAIGEVALPATVFAALRRELGDAVGELAIIHALHAAGYATGAEAAGLVRTAIGGDTAEVGRTAFWRRFGGFFARRGWGTLVHEHGHEAVGLLAASDWIESSDGDAPGGCSFSAGFLSGVLTAVAGGAVAVLEVECRGRGDARCAFAFGSETAIHEVYGEMLDGADLAGALESL